jgi:glycosyltransferase involved in cell wall biosynthesis
MPDRPLPRAPGLSMFFPAYNDAGTIASLVIQAQEAIRHLTPDFEIIVVNDGSRDQTAQIADELARTYPNVRVIHHNGNRGYGGALRSGFSAATKELIAYTDGDAQYDPSEIAALWARLKDDADMVTGYKISRSDPLHRIVIGRIYHYTVKLDRDSGVICLELMRKVQDAGFRVVEVPVHHYHRTHGRSQFFNFRRIFRTGIDVLKLWIELVVLGRGRQSTPVLFRNPMAQRPAGSQPTRGVRP